MKNISYALIAFLLISLAITGCSKKSSANLIGKWKADSVAGMPKDLETQLFYEFTKEKIIASGSVHGQPLDMAEIPYVLKSEEGKTLTLSVVHPVSGAKGEFKITIDGNKMSMLDPDNKPFAFTKIE